jgi:hypothetical protein
MCRYIFSIYSWLVSISSAVTSRFSFWFWRSSRLVVRIYLRCAACSAYTARISSPCSSSSPAHQRLLARSAQRQRVAQKMHLAALPYRALKMPPHDPHQPPVIVRDHVAHATQPALRSYAPGAQKARQLRFQNLLHHPLHQAAKKILLPSALPALHDPNSLSLASHPNVLLR